MALFVVGAVAICALPPLNGFAGEWLLYVGLFRTLGAGTEPGFPVAALAVVALAMIGALAVACFVKLFGAVFLGSPRSQSADHAEDAPISMLIPMLVLAAGCVCIGIVPMFASRLLEDTASTWAMLPDTAITIAAMAPLKWITAMGLALVLLVIAAALAVKALPRINGVSKVGTWDCGYSKPTGRMQYTGTSLSQTLVTLFSFFLWPKLNWPTLRGAFPATGRFASIVPDTILDRLVLPVFYFAGRHLPSLRILQQGQTHLYVLYILIIVIMLLIWGAIGV